MGDRLVFNLQDTVSGNIVQVFNRVLDRRLIFEIMEFQSGAMTFEVNLSGIVIPLGNYDFSFEQYNAANQLRVVSLVTNYNIA